MSPLYDDHSGSIGRLVKGHMVSTMSTSLSWLVVNTHPNRENIAIENLVRQRFETYCPQIRRTLRTRMGAREVLRPLFQNYVFVHVDLEDKALWRPILSTMGVRRVVRFGDRTPTLDAAFIAALRAREVDGAVVKPTALYEIGQEVRIASGAFEGIVGKIIQIESNDRLMILMDLLGQSVRGRIHADQVSR